MQEVWPSITVDESNLRFQMACLRRVICPHGDIIKTIQGRGYLLVAEEVLASEKLVASAVTRHLERQPHAPCLRGPTTVAVVEDDESTREAIEGLLRSSGYVVETYPSPQEFVMARGAETAECLVVDVWLPGQNGLDFQSDLRAAGLDTPIVFISGHADIPMTVRAMKGGAVEFLTKPVRHEELLRAIDGAIKIRRTSQQVI